MDEPLEKSFVQQMQDALQKQLSEFEAAKKKEQHDERIVADLVLRESRYQQWMSGNADSR
jgi:hypothetical protein